MKRWIHTAAAIEDLHEDIFGMSNVLGRFVKVEPNPGFSFYYSPRNSSHGPRVKPVMNAEKMKLEDAGTLALTGDWTFIPGTKDEKVSGKQIQEMKKFFRKYLVLFLLVWEEEANDPDLGYYLQGQMTLSELIQHLTFYEEHKADLDKIETVEALEAYCRDKNLVNMYGN